MIFNFLLDWFPEHWQKNMYVQEGYHQMALHLVVMLAVFFTKLHDIYVMLFCSPETGPCCLHNDNCLRWNMLPAHWKTSSLWLADAFFSTIIPIRIWLFHIPSWINIWYNCQIWWLRFLLGLEYSLPLLILHFPLLCFLKVFCSGYS